MRLQFPGAIYHVMSRGDRQENIFLDDVDRREFLKALSEACLRTAWQVHAYCLMRNHFHLVLETPSPNLVEGMHWLLSTYTIRLNHRHKLVGHVFSGRYKALLVEGSNNGYLKTVCDYLHLNPVRSRLLSQEERLLDYPWSSLMWYLSPPEHRPAWMRVDRLLGEHGIQEDTPAARQEFERRIESRRSEEADGEELKAVRRGWCVGSEDFRKRILASMETMLGENHPAELRQESAEMKAERIIQEELNRLGWSEQDLIARLKCAPEKLAIATRLRKETTLTIRRIAERLHLGTSRSANVRLRKWMRATAFNQSPQSH